MHSETLSTGKTIQKKLLVLSPGSLRESMRKGVVEQLADYSCNEYFDRVIFYHFYVKEPLSMDISDRVTVLEDGAVTPFRIIDLPCYAFRAARIIKKNTIHIIRSTDPYYRGLLGWLLARWFHLPFCISIHADYEKRYELDGPRGGPTIFGSRALAKQLERFILSKADMVMPIRESLREKITANGARPDKVRVIPHGIDLSSIGTPSKTDIYKYFGIEKGKRILSFVGRLSNENYVEDILALGRRLKKKRDDVVIVMVGGGNEEERLNKTIHDDGLQRLVLLAGFQPREVCLDLRRASVAALCLMGGFSMIEACAAGCPVVAYDTEWHSELVRSHETGFLVKENALDELENAILYLLDHPAEADRMGRKAQLLAVERHNLERSFDIKRQCYEELLLKKSAEKR